MSWPGAGRHKEERQEVANQMGKIEGRWKIVQNYFFIILCKTCYVGLPTP
jgi:hypothetical protein